jgi:hypothetical protein
MATEASLVETHDTPGSVESAQANKAAHERRPTSIEIVIGAIKVRVPGGAEARDVEEGVCTMTNRFMRGSAPGRAQPAYLRPAS